MAGDEFDPIHRLASTRGPATPAKVNSKVYDLAELYLISKTYSQLTALDSFRGRRSTTPDLDAQIQSFLGGRSSPTGGGNGDSSLSQLLASIRAGLGGKSNSTDGSDAAALQFALRFAENASDTDDILHPTEALQKALDNTPPPATPSERILSTNGPSTGVQNAYQDVSGLLTKQSNPTDPAQSVQNPHTEPPSDRFLNPPTQTTLAQFVNYLVQAASTLASKGINSALTPKSSAGSNVDVPSYLGFQNDADLQLDDKPASVDVGVGIAFVNQPQSLFGGSLNLTLPNDNGVGLLIPATRGNPQSGSVTNFQLKAGGITTGADAISNGADFGGALPGSVAPIRGGTLTGPSATDFVSTGDAGGPLQLTGGGGLGNFSFGGLTLSFGNFGGQLTLKTGDDGDVEATLPGDDDGIEAAVDELLDAGAENTETPSGSTDSTTSSTDSTTSSTDSTQVQQEDDSEVPPTGPDEAGEGDDGGLEGGGGRGLPGKRGNSGGTTGGDDSNGGGRSAGGGSRPTPGDPPEMSMDGGDDSDNFSSFAAGARGFVSTHGGGEGDGGNNPAALVAADRSSQNDLGKNTEMPDPGGSGGGSPAGQTLDIHTALKSALALKMTALLTGR